LQDRASCRLVVSANARPRCCSVVGISRVFELYGYCAGVLRHTATAKAPCCLLSAVLLAVAAAAAVYRWSTRCSRVRSCSPISMPQMQRRRQAQLQPDDLMLCDGLIWLGVQRLTRAAACHGHQSWICNICHMDEH
jgi:hypothetical protein